MERLRTLVRTKRAERAKLKAILSKSSSRPGLRTNPAVSLLTERPVCYFNISTAELGKKG